MLCERCKYYKEGRCSDPKDFENEHGEPCCRYMEGAHPAKQCRNAVVFDIDGTLADITHLLRLWNYDRGQFYARLGEAKLIKNTHDLWLALFANSYIDIYFYTCRPETARTITEKWLKEFEIYGTLLMKPNDDDRPDHEVKWDMLQKEGLTPDNVLCIIEDRTSVVRALREAGYTVLQCRDNDY